MKKAFTMKEYEEFLNEEGQWAGTKPGTSFRKNSPKQFKDQYERAVVCEDVIECFR